MKFASISRFFVAFPCALPFAGAAASGRGNAWPVN